MKISTTRCSHSAAWYVSIKLLYTLAQISIHTSGLWFTNNSQSQGVGVWGTAVAKMAWNFSSPGFGPIFPSWFEWRCGCYLLKVRLLITFHAFHVIHSMLCNQWKPRPHTVWDSISKSNSNVKQTTNVPVWARCCLCCKKCSAKSVSYTTVSFIVLGVAVHRATKKCIWACATYIQMITV